MQQAANPTRTTSSNRNIDHPEIIDNSAKQEESDELKLNLNRKLDLFMTTQNVEALPISSKWFSINKIHPIEMAALPEFF
jgi:hypothetical protein